MLKICEKCGRLNRIITKSCSHCDAVLAERKRADERLAAEAARVWAALGEEKPLPEPDPQWKIDQDRRSGRRAMEE